MKKVFHTLMLLTFCICLNGQEYFSRTCHVHLSSSNNFKDIHADNYQIRAELDVSNASIKLEGLLKSFEFEVGAIDRVFNSNKVNVSEHPKFSYEGTIENMDEISFDKNGNYIARVKGNLYVWDEKRITPASVQIKILENGNSMTGSANLNIQIEEGSMNKVNNLLKQRLPSAIPVTTQNLGISRDIFIFFDLKMKKL